MIPETIAIDATQLPKFIKLDVTDLPNAIKLELANIPESIKLDTSDMPETIRIVGFPEFIEVRGNIPSEIMVRVPENMSIPLYYAGPPVPIKFDMTSFTGEDGNPPPCFTITPCQR